MRLGTKALLVTILSMIGVLLFPNIGIAETFKWPSGMMVRDEDGAYYYTYYTPGTDYADPRLKYIGHGEVLNYYLSRGRKVYDISNAEKAGFTIHNHNLSFPCGEVARDSFGRIAFYEPLGWPPGAQDQGDTVFSSAENFPQYVQYISWDLPANQGGHVDKIVKQNGWNDISIIDGLPLGSEGGISPYGIPNCAIVKQINSPDYYRVFRHMTPEGASIQRKAKISNPEILSSWLNFNSYTYETDITSLPNVGMAGLPPGLLVRTIYDPTVYFIDDEGYKVKIPTQATFDKLGFTPNEVTFVSPGSLWFIKDRVIY